jgi:hypothetical protein
MKNILFILFFTGIFTFESKAQSYYQVGVSPYFYQLRGADQPVYKNSKRRLGFDMEFWKVFTPKIDAGIAIKFHRIDGNTTVPNTTFTKNTNYSYTMSRIEIPVMAKYVFLEKKYFNCYARGGLGMVIKFAGTKTLTTQTIDGSLLTGVKDTDFDPHAALQMGVGIEVPFFGKDSFIFEPYLSALVGKFNFTNYDVNQSSIGFRTHFTFGKR